MARLEFWFDFSCPYAYIASTRVEALAARVGAELDPRPMLLGGVFRARGTPQNLAGALSPAKSRHNLDDIRRQAQRAGVPLRMPANHPQRTVEALRCLLAVGPPYLPLAHRLYRAYWVESADIGAREVLARVLAEAGLDAEAVLARAAAPEIKEELRRRTDEAVARGVFGVPTFFVGDAMFWGQDRMDMVEEALGGAPARPVPGGTLAPVDFWFDYSSPFAYLALTRVEAVFGAAARWRPLLLGGLFRAIGTPDVPLFEQSPEKRRHTRLDLDRQAARVGAAFRWPSHFPARTVLPLRVTLAAGASETPGGRALIRGLARALWVEDRDLADPAVVREVCEAHGFDGAALLERAGSPEVRARLQAETAAAAEAGVFGVPTFVVHAPQGPRLYWGADRLELAAAAAAGDPSAL